MAKEIFMPKLSSTMDTGTITEWFKNEGDEIKVGDVIFEVMTDKIAIEVEAYEEGILLKRYLEVDGTAPVNSVIGYIGKAGEEVPATMEYGTAEVKPTENSAETSAPLAEELAATAVFTSDGSRATPAARKLARERGIPLSSIAGSGKNGRIHKEDVEAGAQISVAAPKSEIKFTPWKGMRSIIAKNMQKSKNTAPHVTMHMDVDMTEGLKLRANLLPLIESESGYKISLTEIVIMALAKSLKKHPEMNALVKEDGIYQHSDINIGVAVALDDGLIIPVIKNADNLGLSALTSAVKIGADKARNSKLKPDEITGGTFTISTLGRTPVTYFTPVINPPEAAILGVGGMFKKLVLVDGAAQNRDSLPLSLSFDHRAIDGAPAAVFLETLKKYLENPGLLLI